MALRTLLIVALLTSKAKANNETSEVGSVTVSKCCQVDEVLVETSITSRVCRKRSDLLHIDLRMARSKWEPAFYEEGREVIGPRTTIVVNVGLPDCDLRHDILFSATSSRRYVGRPTILAIQRPFWHSIWFPLKMPSLG